MAFHLSDCFYYFRSPLKTDSKPVMDHYLLLLTIVGLATFTMAWMPRFAQKTGISYSVFYVLAGFLLYTFFPEQLPDPLPQNNKLLTLHLTELIVIIALMGTGIKIDRKFSFKNWSAPLKLIGITMILCIVAAALMGYYFLGLGLASAILLAAVLAPTDPVLANDVQEGPPNENERSDTKFILTSEAGLNDGVAFPFTWLAIALGLIVAGKDMSLFQWFTYDLLYRIAAGIGLGYIFGKGIGFLLFGRSKERKVLRTRDGLLAVATTLLVYGVTELIHAYGFIGVFVCAITIRHYEKEHEYHDELHSFTDQIERMLVCLLLLLFGGSIASGILQPITWKMAFFVLSFLFLVRPVFGLLGLMGSKLKFREKLAISFFGIRGMGSVFYLAFAFSQFNFEEQDELWAIVALTILISVSIHGLSANTIMKHLSKNANKK